MISSLMFIWLRSTLPQFASYLSSFQTDPSNVHELSDYITYLNIRDSVKKSFYSALDAYQAS
ncbi:hypothetical protein IMAU80162_01035 [Lactiplantibacillus plantarum]|nr:hypothetical protein [Lactiplantibacillus plantarum]